MKYDFSFLCFFAAATLLLTACGNSSEHTDVHSSRPVVRMPSADGDITYGNDLAVIDASHTEDGYLMVDYTGNANKIKLLISGPDAVTYTYDLTSADGYDTFPLSAGDGMYTVGIYENIDGDNYSTAFLQDLDVTLKNEFTPFLYPNQFVNYTEDTKAVTKGQELADGADDDLAVVTNIYHFVTQNITYDYDKAETVTSGYLPDIDETLSSKTGICFDYAALMICMLRTQNIPTKLQIGYAGELYHAWISTYLQEHGWVDNIIRFDGKDWTMMDPTFAASSEDSAQKFTEDFSNYLVKYSR